MSTNNLIPSINAAGRFEALAPFDQVVNPDKFYTVEALRTITEMESLKMSLYSLIFKPVGLVEADFPTVMDRARQEGSIIVTLLDRSGKPTYVPSTYFKAFPLTDGVIYERMCVIADMGPCPPDMADVIAQVMAHMQEYILNTVGIDSTVKLGTIPVMGYASRQQADAFHAARLNNIQESNNDIARIRELEERIVKRDQYILELESRLTLP